MRAARMQYCIKSVPTDDTVKLENLLNEMSAQGWDIYTMHEAEGEEDEGFIYNCIFVREAEDETSDEDIDDVFGYQNRMQKMISSQNEPYEQCLSVQAKIKDKRKSINEEKNLLSFLKDTLGLYIFLFIYSYI